MKKVFKYLRHSMLLAAVALFAFSCAESEVVEGKLNTPSDSAFTASTLSFDFGYEGGSSPITITVVELPDLSVVIARKKRLEVLSALVTLGAKFSTV